MTENTKQPKAQKLVGVKGMNDILPPDSARWEWFEDKVRALMQRYGYLNVRTPIVEPTPLFVRSATLSFPANRAAPIAADLAFAATGTVVFDAVNGVVTGVTLTSNGSGYSPANPPVPQFNGGSVITAASATSSWVVDRLNGPRMRFSTSSPRRPRPRFWSLEASATC